MNPTSNSLVVARFFELIDAGDGQAALRRAKELAEEGSILGSFLAGWVYEQGATGVDRQLSLSADWYGRAVEESSRRAATDEWTDDDQSVARLANYALGWGMLRGFDGKSNVQAGVDLVRKAAHEGLPEAEMFFAILLRKAAYRDLYPNDSPIEYLENPIALGYPVATLTRAKIAYDQSQLLTASKYYFRGLIQLYRLSEHDARRYDPLDRLGLNTSLVSCLKSEASAEK